MTGDQIKSTIELLLEGFGVEDIALKKSIPQHAIRDLVDKLRRSGRLKCLISESRKGK